MSTVTPVHVAPTAQRSAEPSRFDAALRAAADGAARGLAATAALAAPIVPGGPLLAGAVRGAVASAASAAVSPAPAPGAAGGHGPDLLEATRALQLQAQSFNLQYLHLQEALQREGREFTAISNVMKARHDAARAAIANIH
ncbi:MAG TPA: hypothetical protein VH880_14330 [Anaeromyxobacteraceae bacterium]|jgi:hypothetical protein